METTVTTRQLKISRQIQRDISDIFIKEGADLIRGTMVSVTVVRMSPDLSLAKVYLSIFPFERSAQMMEAIRANAHQLRFALAKRMKNQIKSIPEVAFFLDDSQDYAAKIDTIFKERVDIKPLEEDEE